MTSTTPPNKKNSDAPIDQISAANFKALCLKLMDQVEQNRRPIVITKRGRPVAKLVPIEADTTPGLYGYLAGTGWITGDVISPLNDGPWVAETE